MNPKIDIPTTEQHLRALVAKPVDISEMPADDRSRRAWLKYQLELRGYTLSSLAKEIGVGRTTVCAALATPYPKMQRVIAERLGVRPEQLWPERYDRKAV